MISATMGSFSRVIPRYCDLDTFLVSRTEQNPKAVVLGAFMNGESIYSLSKSLFKDSENQVFLVMGNESHGVSKELSGLITEQISIPKVGGAESLNVAIATSILCDNLIRLST